MNANLTLIEFIRQLKDKDIDIVIRQRTTKLPYEHNGRISPLRTHTVEHRGHLQVLTEGRFAVGYAIGHTELGPGLAHAEIESAVAAYSVYAGHPARIKQITITLKEVTI